MGANKRSCANALCMWTENSVPCPDLIQVFNIGTAIVLNRSFNIKLDIALTTPFLGGGALRVLYIIYMFYKPTPCIFVMFYVAIRILQ